MTKVLHVKLPVTDLQRSLDWYASLMDLHFTHEFIEDDEVRGVALRSAEGGFSFALRLREHCAGQPDLDGFDVVALHMADRDAIGPHARAVRAARRRVLAGAGPRRTRGRRGRARP
jgi:catechol 2,3-dioxygenase-like lactoylglutathione lyase family enzyme